MGTHAQGYVFPWGNLHVYPLTCYVSCGNLLNPDLAPSACSTFGDESGRESATKWRNLPLDRTRRLLSLTIGLRWAPAPIGNVAWTLADCNRNISEVVGFVQTARVWNTDHRRLNSCVLHLWPTVREKYLAKFCGIITFDTYVYDYGGDLPLRQCILYSILLL